MKCSEKYSSPEYEVKKVCCPSKKNVKPVNNYNFECCFITIIVQERYFQKVNNFRNNGCTRLNGSLRMCYLQVPTTYLPTICTRAYTLYNLTNEYFLYIFIFYYYYHTLDVKTRRNNNIIIVTWLLQVPTAIYWLISQTSLVVTIE